MVFGEVVSGFEVLDLVEGVKCNKQDRPEEDVTIVDCGVINGVGQGVAVEETAGAA